MHQKGFTIEYFHVTSVKVAAVSLHTTPLDFNGNTKSILSALQSEACLHSDFILFPELCISGYGCEDAFYKESLWKRSWESLDSIRAATKDKIVIVGLPVFHRSFLYNCVAILAHGKIIALVPKLNLANTGIHYEKRWFHAPTRFIKEVHHSTYDTSYANGEIPFGHFIFEYKGINFGLEICEDSWVVDRPVDKYAKQGLDVLFSPGASHFAIGKRNIRHQIFKETSRSHQLLTVFTNLCGNEAGRSIYDGGSFFCEDGVVINEGKRLFFANFQITTHNTTLATLRNKRAKELRIAAPYSNASEEDVPILRIQEPTISPILVDLRSESNSPKNNDESFDPLSKTDTQFEDFTRAVALGLFDYLRKSKTNGYTLSLSGGADSAACALLVDCMKRLAKAEMGPSIFNSLGIEESKLLVTLYQKTENNSHLTEDIANLLTQELGIRHHQISIDESVAMAISLIQSTQDRKISWEDDDLALQNIQARVRSPLIWLLANLNGHLLISTGNRSEASVGYTTMDGDASGSVCPISGVSKEFILQWLDDIQSGKNRYIAPKESIALLRKTKPTAELRPLSENQEDEKDLMPYPILQQIEQNLVHYGMDIEICLFRLKEKFPNISEEHLRTHISRFTKLFAASQWKRERLAPSFHLDTYGLDPKTSYRYPILSAGF